MSNPILQAAVRAILIDAERDNIRISGLHIDGVEVTQAIQYRSADQHLTDSADRGPDNSIRLVADKAARYAVRSQPPGAGVRRHWFGHGAAETLRRVGGRWRARAARAEQRHSGAESELR